jgi:transposase-like protein
VRKGQTRLEGFNDRIIALYARGMTTRDIRAHLREMYDVDVSADLISRVTDGVLEELAEWQSRPLDPVWPVIFIDAEFTPFLAFPPEVRRVIYTTNLIESMNARLRKVTRNRGQFPSEQATLKVLYLAVRNLEDYRGPHAGIRSSGSRSSTCPHARRRWRGLPRPLAPALCGGGLGVRGRPRARRDAPRSG